MDRTYFLRAWAQVILRSCPTQALLYTWWEGRRWRHELHTHTGERFVVRLDGTPSDEERVLRKLNEGGLQRPYVVHAAPVEVPRA
ncbi:MAG: hypothetical protein KC501_25070 [Myxococcales bacterium]|nr:hypothetical protein [Myxococcales bacterium]